MSPSSYPLYWMQTLKYPSINSYHPILIRFFIFVLFLKICEILYLLFSHTTFALPGFHFHFFLEKSILLQILESKELKEIMSIIRDKKKKKWKWDIWKRLSKTLLLSTTKYIFLVFKDEPTKVCPTAGKHLHDEAKPDNIIHVFFIHEKYIVRFQTRSVS